MQVKLPTEKTDWSTNFIICNNTFKRLFQPSQKKNRFYWNVGFMGRNFFDARTTILFLSLILFSTIFAQTCYTPTYNVPLGGTCDIVASNTTLRNCAPGLGCIDSLCATQNQTALLPCTTSAECSALGNYNVLTNYAHVCVRRISDGQKYCRPPISSRTSGFECETNSDCASNDCDTVNKVCNIFTTDVATTCTSNLQCYSGGSDITKRLVCSATTTSTTGTCVLRNVALNSACTYYTSNTASLFPNSNNCAPNLNCYGASASPICVAPADVGQACGIGANGGVRYCAVNAISPTFCQFTTATAGVCTRFTTEVLGQPNGGACFTGDDCIPGSACEYSSSSSLTGICTANSQVACNNDNAHVKCKSQSKGGFCSCTSTSSNGVCSEATDGVINANACKVQYRTLQGCLRNAGCWSQFSGNLTDTNSCGAPCSAAMQGVICCYARQATLQIRTNVPAGFDYAICSAQSLFSNMVLLLVILLSLLFVQ